MTNNACSAISTPPGLECQVCFDSFREPVELTSCGHMFCRQCVSSKTTLCPICRCPVAGIGMPRDAIIQAAEQVPVACGTCGWRGTRKVAELHRCNVHETHTSYTRSIPQSDDAWLRFATSKQTNTISEAQRAPTPTQYVMGVPLN